MKRNLVVGLAVLLASTVWAQDREREVEGIVQSIEEWSIEIKLEKGDPVTLHIRYVKDGKEWVRDKEQQSAIDKTVRKGARIWARFYMHEGKRYIEEFKILDGGQDGETPDGLADHVVEGRVLRVDKRGSRMTLILLVEGLRRELEVPRVRIDGRTQFDPELERMVAELRTGYFIGVGYAIENEALVLKWVFLVRGGKIDRSDEWEKKRQATMGDKEKEREREAKEWDKRREEKERERERHDKEERERREKQKEHEKRREREKEKKKG